MRCAQITIAYIAGVSSIQSCFSQVSVLVNRHRAGIALISPTHLYILLNGMLATYSLNYRGLTYLFVHLISVSFRLKHLRNLSLFIGSLLLVAALCVTFGKTKDSPLQVLLLQHLVVQLRLMII